MLQNFIAVNMEVAAGLPSIAMLMAVTAGMYGMWWFACNLGNHKGLAVSLLAAVKVAVVMPLVLAGILAVGIGFYYAKPALDYITVHGYWSGLAIFVFVCVGGYCAIVLEDRADHLKSP